MSNLVQHAVGRRILAALAAIGVCTAAACSPPTSTSHAEKPSIFVYGAASTRVLNDDITATTPIDATIKFVNGGSGSLVQQLADGAPGDVLITADRPTMDKAISAGIVSEPRVVAQNSMVLIVPKGNPGAITGADGSLNSAKVVTCDIKVPCGAVAQSLISELGLTFSPVSTENSVTDVVSKVTSGAADAGWVYRTDAKALAGTVDVFDIAGAGDHANEIMAAVVSQSANVDQARALVEFLSTPASAGMWTRHGFELPRGGVARP